MTTRSGWFLIATCFLAACPSPPSGGGRPNPPRGGAGGSDPGAGGAGWMGGTGGGNTGGTGGTGGAVTGGASGAGAGGAMGGRGGATTDGSVVPPPGDGAAGDRAPRPDRPAPVPSCPGLPTPLAGDRCGAGVIRSQGNDPLIDDFEPAPTDTATCRLIRAVDGRVGNWEAFKDSSSDAATFTRNLEPPGPGGAPNSTRALHAVGSGIMRWARLAVSLAPCYDASKYRGISFWLKGNPALSSHLKVMVATPGTAEAADGGRCVPKAGVEDGDCEDHFTVHMFKLGDIWTRFGLTWKQLAQMGFGQLAGGTYRPETEIITLLFAPQWPDDAPAAKAFDFWIDDISLDPGSGYSATGFTSIITKAKFDAGFATKRTGALHSFYANAYNDFSAVLNQPEFSRIGREGDADDRKREIAAFLAHVQHETVSLQYTTENTPSHDYCNNTYSQYPCAPGQTYIGRGPLQVSWNYNYGPASLFFGLGTQYLTNPGSVIATPETGWRSAALVWMAWKDAARNTLKFGSHYRFLNEGFGATIRAINGSRECPTSPGRTARIANYQAFCASIGTTGCDRNLACPPN